MKIEIRRNANEPWFLFCYAGTLVGAYTEINRKRAQGYHVRVTNNETGFIIHES